MPNMVICSYCDRHGPDRGFLWTDNNGPIVACPICNSEYDSLSAQRQREFDAAERQRTSRLPSDQCGGG